MLISHNLGSNDVLLEGKVIMHKDFPYEWCINKSLPFILQSGFDIIKYFKIQMVEICLCTMHKENPYA
jgi:hypothetical protein